LMESAPSNLLLVCIDMARGYTVYRGVLWSRKFNKNSTLNMSRSSAETKAGRGRGKVAATG